MKKNSLKKDILIIGFTLFASFFGAGNLIFPLALGLEAGSSWPYAMLGLIITGIALPILAIISVSRSGGSFKDLTRPISPWFYTLYNAFVFYALMVFIFIPRTGAMAYESGLHMLFPQAPSLLMIVLFFGLTLYFCFDQSHVVDKVGLYLTPFLLVFLLIMIGKGMISPLYSLEKTSLAHPFSKGLLTGYQTGDLVAGFIFVTFIMNDIVKKGYSKSKTKKISLTASLIAFLLLVLIYSGFMYLGASSAARNGGQIEHTQLLLQTIQNILGTFGSRSLSLVIFLACLTTSVSLTSSAASFTQEITSGKINYRWAVILICLFSSIQATRGVDSIISIADPLLAIIYPISIILVFLGLLAPLIPNSGVYKGSIALTFLFTILDLVWVFLEGKELLPNFLRVFPFYEQGFSWLFFALAGGILGGLFWPTKETTSN